LKKIFRLYKKEGAVNKQMFFVAIAAISLVGCATTKSQPMTTDLQMRVGELERELETKDEKIKDLEYTVKDLTYEVDRLKTGTSRATSDRSEGRKSSSTDDRIVRVSASPQEVQQALKKAGYYKGPIDGNIGSGTKSAISQFQRDKGLKADGVIGQKTWSELKAFLE
jgi:murein L,D-transpeptidase YcbB/YkuD